MYRNTTKDSVNVLMNQLVKVRLSKLIGFSHDYHSADVHIEFQTFSTSGYMYIDLHIIYICVFNRHHLLGAIKCHIKGVWL